MRHRMLSLAALVVLSCMAGGALAQTGPLEARMVMAAMPTPLPSSRKEGLEPVQLFLSIGSDGRVSEVKVEKSSGDPAFDEKLRKYYRKVRFIPALTEAGTPIEGSYEFMFRSTTDTSPLMAAAGGNFYYGSPAPTEVSNSAVPRDKLFDEVARVNRMRCQDFLWEYDLMKDIAGARPVYNELMLRTSRAMYLVQEKVSGDSVHAFDLIFTQAVRAAVDQCRKRPDDTFFRDVFVPTIKGKLAPG